MRRVEAERSAADAAAALETSRQQFESMEVCAMGGARHPLTARVRAPRIAQWCRSRARHRGPLTRNLSSVGFWEVRQTKKKNIAARHARALGGQGRRADVGVQRPGGGRTRRLRGVVLMAGRGRTLLTSRARGSESPWRSQSLRLERSRSSTDVTTQAIELSRAQGESARLRQALDEKTLEAAKQRATVEKLKADARRLSDVRARGPLAAKGACACELLGSTVR